MGSVSLAPTLTPHGRLALVEGPDAPLLDPELAQRLRNAFERGSGHGLLQLGAAEVGAALPPVFSYWREFGAWYVTALCTHPDTEAPPRKVRVPAPPDAELDRLVLAVPPMTGAEYLTAEVLRRPLAGTGRRIRHRTGRVEMRDTGLPEAPEPCVEPGRPRALQSGRKPQRPGSAFRLSRNLHHAVVGAMPRPNIFRWGRLSANMRARQTRTVCCRCSFPCSEHRRLARG